MNPITREAKAVLFTDMTPPDIFQPCQLNPLAFGPDEEYLEHYDY